ncbi:MAG: sugar phosphate isomerase/epimerase family protein [Armatimonadota bacterium]
MLRYGISTWIVRDLPADEAADALAGAGFEEVELSADACALVQAWERDPVGARDRMRQAGLDIRSIHSPEAGRHLDAVEREVREAAIAANVVYFERMSDSGVREIVIHPTGSVDVRTEAMWAAARQRSVEALKTLAEPAGQAGVRLALENLPRNGRRCSSVAELLEMIEGLGDHVGVCFDVGHAEMDAMDLIEEVATASRAGKLFSLHLHDVDAEGKDHFIPGEGRIEWSALLTELDAFGFEGGRILEVAPPRGDIRARLREVGALRMRWEAEAR